MKESVQEKKLTQFELYFENKEFVWKPGLERIKRAVGEVGFKSFPSIIVAGTNGKGSTSHMIAEILKQNGLKVGLFTSPHLFRFNERFKVDMKEIETEVLDSCFEEILQFVEKHQLTYFEGAFLLSLKIFSELRVDAAVFEVGLGGRLDATNAVPHDLAVITHVDFDHRDYLGNTLEEIAREKVAVIKDEIPAVISENPPVVEELASERTKELYVYGKDFKADNVELLLDGTELDYEGRRVKTTLLGKHQAINAVTALKASEVFLRQKFSAALRMIDEINVSLPGRFEIIRRNPTIVFDVAHNRDALRKLFETAREVGLRADVIFSGLKDKDLEENLKIVSEYLSYSKRKLYLLEIENERAVKQSELVKIAQSVGIENVSILERVSLESLKDDTIITGSFYMAELIDGYGRV